MKNVTIPLGSVLNGVNSGEFVSVFDGSIESGLIVCLALVWGLAHVEAIFWLSAFSSTRLSPLIVYIALVRGRAHVKEAIWLGA